MVRGDHLRRLRREVTGVLARSDGDEHESGLTLVELIVAVVIILLVMFPFGALFYNTLNLSASNASRQNAALVASTVLSHLDQTTYGDVGFMTSAITSAISSNSSYATATTGVNGTTYSWTPNEDGDTASETLVQVSTQPSFTVGTSATVFAPIMTDVIQGNTRYTVYTHILQVSASVLSCTGTTTVSDAYDRAFVEVVWANGAVKSQTLWQDKLIYPGGLSAVAATGATPSTPTISSAKPQTVSGEVIVNWTLPTGWTSTTSCFRVGWADVNQNEYSSGYLTEAASGTSTCPAVVGTLSPTYFTVSGSTASYCVTGLTQGGSSQVYDFYVTAYPGTGTGTSAESGDSSADAPLGPTITDIAPVSGKSGTSIALTGTDFLTSNQPFEFCSATVTCTSSFTAGCAATASKYCTTVNCASATSCTVPAPTLLSTATSGAYFIIAETTGSPPITSAPQAVNEFVYAPTITGTSVVSGDGSSGSTIKVTGTNLFASSTGFDFNEVSATNVTCSAGGLSCTMTVPDDSSGNPVNSGTASLVAIDYSIQSASFTYTY